MGKVRNLSSKVRKLQLYNNHTNNRNRNDQYVLVFINAGQLYLASG